MNKPKRSLRSTLRELTASFTDAVLAAARESLAELASREKPRARERARSPRPRPVAAVRPSAAKSPKRVRTEPPTAPLPETANDASDLFITDPQALLTALETSEPYSASNAADDAPPREEPEILRPVSAPVASRESQPVLREGEVVVRRSAAGVVLRRRRA